MKAGILLFGALLALSACGPAKDDGATTSRERVNRDRAQQVYSRFAGLYRGTVTPFSGDRRPLPVEMELRVIEVREGVNENNEPEFRPELRGYFHPTDYDLGIIPQARRPISGRYYEDRDQLVLNQTELVNGRIPDQGRVSVTGTFRDGEIDGNINFTIVSPVSGRLTVRRVRE